MLILEQTLKVRFTFSLHSRVADQDNQYTTAIKSIGTQTHLTIIILVALIPIKYIYRIHH